MEIYSLNETRFNNNSIIYESDDILEFKNLTLNELQFSNYNFNKIIFNNILFENCIITNCGFADCIFINCLFKNCKLYALRFYSDCILKKINFNSTQIYNCIFSRFDFTYSSIFSTKISNSNFDLSNFHAALIENCVFEYTSFYHTIFSKADIKFSELVNCNFALANFSRAFIYNINFTNSFLPAPNNILSANWGNVSRELTMLLMKYDSMNHANPELFSLWANGCRCPYENVFIERASHFQEKHYCWDSSVEIKSLYELMLLCFKDAKITI